MHAYLRQNIIHTLYPKQCGLCFWCKSEIIVDELVDADLVIDETQLVVFYICNNQLLIRRKGSVDHVIPKWAGGRNYIENLVLSCVKCNLERSLLDIMCFGHLQSYYELPLLPIDSYSGPDDKGYMQKVKLL